MSFDDRLLHTLTVRRNVPTGSYDDYGQAVTAPWTVATVRGLIQPRSAREVALASQGGVTIGEHVGYLRVIPGLTAADWVEHDGVRFDIVTISDAGGIGHHLELGLRKVV
jgi:hypothetical protein